MRIGAAPYRHVLDALDAAGLPGDFIQTGGMNAALLVHLEGGRALLITDADDALSWDRDDQDGWGVSLYPDETLDSGPHVSDSCRGSDTASLIALVRTVLDRFRRSVSTDERRCAPARSSAEPSQPDEET